MRGRIDFSRFASRTSKPSTISFDSCRFFSDYAAHRGIVPAKATGEPMAYLLAPCHAMSSHRLSSSPPHSLHHPMPLSSLSAIALFLHHLPYARSLFTISLPPVFFTTSLSSLLYAPLFTLCTHPLSLHSHPPCSLIQRRRKG